MKKVILSIGFLIAMASFSGAEASNINVSVNIGVQPAWGPVGYNYAAFYYFPDINVYYNVNQGMFHYPYRGGWASARYLPSLYRNYDLYGLYKVVISDPNPWYYNQRHMYDYRQYRGNRSQVAIRNSYDDRYRDSRRNDVRWYNDNNGRGSSNNYYNNNRDNNNYYGRDNNGRSTADRQWDSDKNGRGNGNNSQGNNNSNKPENVGHNRSNGNQNDRKYTEVSYSENQGRNNNTHRDNSSSRSSSGRSSSSGRR